MLLLLALLACSDVGFTPIPASVETPEAPEAPTPHIEHASDFFEQEAEVLDLDVYALIDQSCSMDRADDDNVASALRLLLLDLDLRMGAGGEWSLTLATTATVQPDPLRSWTRTAGNLDSATLDEIGNAVHSIGRASEEAGLAAAWGLTAYPVPDIAPADLYLIITDEDDQSYPPTSSHTITGDVDGDGQWSYMERRWSVAEFDAWQASQPLTDVLLIVPTVDGCGWSVPRFESVAAATVIDFCGNWGTALSQRSFLTALGDSFTLSNDPIPGSVRVVVDGSMTAAWSISGRVVTLETPPPDGAMVEIAYRYWSL